MAVFQGFWQVCFYSLNWYLNKRWVLGSSLALSVWSVLRIYEKALVKCAELTPFDASEHQWIHYGYKNQWPMVPSQAVHAVTYWKKFVTVQHVKCQGKKQVPPEWYKETWKEQNVESLSWSATIRVSPSRGLTFIIAAPAHFTYMTDLILNASVNTPDLMRTAVFNEMLNYVKQQEGNHSSTAGGLQSCKPTGQLPITIHHDCKTKQTSEWERELQQESRLGWEALWWQPSQISQYKLILLLIES